MECTFIDGFADALKTIKPKKSESLENVILRAARKMHARKRK